LERKSRQIVEQGGKSLRRCVTRNRDQQTKTKLIQAILDAAYQQLDRSYDPKEGGFAGAKISAASDAEFLDAILAPRS